MDSDSNKRGRLILVYSVFKVVFIVGKGRVVVRIYTKRYNNTKIMLMHLSNQNPFAKDSKVENCSGLHIEMKFVR